MDSVLNQAFCRNGGDSRYESLLEESGMPQQRYHYGPSAGKGELCRCAEITGFVGDTRP